MFTFSGCFGVELLQSGLNLLHEKSILPKNTERYSNTLKKLASIFTGNIRITSLSAHTSEAFTALELISKYTFPIYCHRRGVIELSLLFSTLTNTLKTILAFAEDDTINLATKFVPPLLNTETDATRLNEIFLTGSLFVKRLLTYKWPCGVCYPNETVLSHLTQSTGSL